MIDTLEWRKQQDEMEEGACYWRYTLHRVTDKGRDPRIIAMVREASPVTASQSPGFYKSQEKKNLHRSLWIPQLGDSEDLKMGAHIYLPRGLWSLEEAQAWVIDRLMEHQEWQGVVSDGRLLREFEKKGFIKEPPEHCRPRNDTWGQGYCYVEEVKGAPRTWERNVDIPVVAQGFKQVTNQYSLEYMDGCFFPFVVWRRKPEVRK